MICADRADPAHPPGTRLAVPRLMQAPSFASFVLATFAVAALATGACSSAELGPPADDADGSSAPQRSTPEEELDSGVPGLEDAPSTPVEAGAATCAADAKSGTYCGDDKITSGDPSTLYTCAGPGAPVSARKCIAGCSVNPGQDDTCNLQQSPNSYRLPWTKGTSMQLTQDCNDSCCSDHVASDEYAWDWANGGSFLVRAARAGTITHLKINSTKGCATTACSTDVNMIVVDHGDGSHAIYMHLAGNTLAAGVTCGSAVTQGQPLAMAGTTGHSTGVHLHFQVSQVHPGVAKCECGSDGKQCATTFNPFPNAWVNAPFHTLPIAFEEWPSASMCKNRRMTMPAALSQ
jgi:Peptidase family M23